MNKIYIKNIIILFIIILFSITCYEIYISYNNLTTTNYTINSNKINDDINVVIISDLHENSFGEDNKELIDNIQKQSPDIVLVVGDMINKDSENIEPIANLMKKLSEVAPIFYSLGNTEYDNTKKFNSNIISKLKDTNVKFLNNKYEDIKINNQIVRIGGMYDYAFALSKGSTYDFLCDFQNTDNYKIMLAHRPDSFIFGDASEIWNVDLVVSGHTHGGQVRIPFLGGLYVADQGYLPKYDKGLFNLNKIKILISSGLGAGKQKLPRFNNPPEIVNLKLNNK